MPHVKQLQKLINDFQDRQPIRAGSLIITVYGDIVAPHGGSVWLGSLINLLEPLGLNDRLVRTTVSRLSKDNWLAATQVGRRSYYALTKSGQRRFDSATPRVYAGPRVEWDETWCSVILPASLKTQKDAVKKELGWLGFGQINTNVLIHPKPNIKAMQQTLEDLDVMNDVVILSQADQQFTTDEARAQMVNDCWKMDELAERYQDFLDIFQPVADEISNSTRPDLLSSTLLRILLVHEYRKILLRDPLLPLQLLPDNWQGTAAHQLCKDLYRQVLDDSEKHLNEALETEEGSLPKPSKDFYDRFGGL